LDLVIYREAFKNCGDIIINNKLGPKKVDIVAISREKKALLSKTRPPRIVYIIKILFNDDEVKPNLSKKGKGSKGRVYTI